MKIVSYLRDGEIFKGIEVNKKELIDIIKKLEYVSVSKADTTNIDNADSFDIVGTIMGDIDNIIHDLDLFDTLNLKDKEIKYCENPDCWFVNSTSMNKSYKPLTLDTLFKFGEAIELMKLGYKVARIGWNGKGMFLFLVPGSTFKVNRPPLLGIYEEGTEIKYHAHIDMKTAQGDIVPWLASQTDMLAEDYVIVIV